jgi:hypothetical protein
MCTDGNPLQQLAFVNGPDDIDKHLPPPLENFYPLPEIYMLGVPSFCDTSDNYWSKIYVGGLPKNITNQKVIGIIKKVTNAQLVSFGKHKDANLNYFHNYGFGIISTDQLDLINKVRFNIQGEKVTILKSRTQAERNAIQLARIHQNPAPANSTNPYNLLTLPNNPHAANPTLNPTTTSNVRNANSQP